MKARLKTILLTSAALALTAGNVWAATSAAAVINQSATLIGDITQNAYAYGLSTIVVAGGAYTVASGHPKLGLCEMGGGFIAGSAAHNGATLSGLFGGASSALIHIPHHAHIIASAITRFFA